MHGDPCAVLVSVLRAGHGAVHMMTVMQCCLELLEMRMPREALVPLGVFPDSETHCPRHSVVTLFPLDGRVAPVRVLLLFFFFCFFFFRLPVPVVLLRLVRLLVGRLPVVLLVGRLPVVLL
jgi:hypothetical protein